MKSSEKSANGCFFQDSLQSDQQTNLSGERQEMKEIPEGYNKTYQELAGVLKNDRQVHAVWEHYAGVSVTFPKSLYSRKYTRELIREAMDREKPAGIARRTGLTERRVRQIIREIRLERTDAGNGEEGDASRMNEGQK